MRQWPSVRDFDNVTEWAEEIQRQLIQLELELSQTSGTVGMIAEFDRSALPSGWLEADGSTFDEAGFPVLAQILGGSTLPNLAPQYDVSHIVGIKAA